MRLLIELKDGRFLEIPHEHLPGTKLFVKQNCTYIPDDQPLTVQIIDPINLYDKRLALQPIHDAPSHDHGVGKKV